MINSRHSIPYLQKATLSQVAPLRSHLRHHPPLCLQANHGFSTGNKGNIRAKKGKPMSSSKLLWRVLSPHALLALILIGTSNAHLTVIPATTAAFHYMYRYNHFARMTMYYDLSAIGDNENYLAVFDKIKEVMMTDERLQLFIE